MNENTVNRIKKNTGDVDLKLDFFYAKRYEDAQLKEQHYYALQNETIDYLARARRRNKRQLKQQQMPNLYNEEDKEATFTRTLRKKEQK